MTTSEQIERWFTCEPPDEPTRFKLRAMMAKFRELARDVDTEMLPGPEKDNAIKAIVEAVAWVRAGIANSNTATTCETRALGGLSSLLALGLQDEGLTHHEAGKVKVRSCLNVHSARVGKDSGCQECVEFYARQGWKTIRPWNPVATPKGEDGLPNE